mgnify:CR=1 FL=1
MFRVAICDDEKTICSQIEKVILDYQKNCAEKIDILTFLSGEELYKIIKDVQAFDLIFLDIELDKLNGIEVGKIIREELNDNITQIVYISANKDYAMELFENRPLNFLVKPICCEKIIKSLNAAINLHKNSDLFFEFCYNYNFIKIPYKKIMYFESNDKKINVITTDEIYEYYGKLSELKKQVKEKDFIQIHKSLLVNYQYIVEVSYEKIKLTNGEKLNISQSYRKEVRNNIRMRRKELYK